MRHKLQFLGQELSYVSDGDSSSLFFSTGTVLKLSNGRFILVNCAEGTQAQFLKHSVNFGRVDIVLITKLSFSHVSGLSGMLAMLLYKKREENPHVTIIGPKGIEQFCTHVLQVTDTFFKKIGMTFIEIEPNGQMCSLKQRVHTLPIQGDKKSVEIYAIGEKRESTRDTCFNECSFFICTMCQSGLDESKLLRYGIHNNGEMKKILGSKNQVQLDDNTIVTYDMVSAKSRLDRMLVVCPFISSEDQASQIISSRDAVLEHYINGQLSSYGIAYLLEDECTRKKFDYREQCHELRIAQSHLIHKLAVEGKSSLVVHICFLPNSVGGTLHGSIRLSKEEQIQIEHVEESVKEAVWLKSNRGPIFVEILHNNSIVSI